MARPNNKFLGTTIGTNSAPPYAYKFMDHVESEIFEGPHDSSGVSMV